MAHDPRIPSWHIRSPTVLQILLFDATTADTSNTDADTNIQCRRRGINDTIEDTNNNTANAATVDKKKIKKKSANVNGYENHDH